MLKKAPLSSLTNVSAEKEHIHEMSLVYMRQRNFNCNFLISAAGCRQIKEDSRFRGWPGVKVLIYLLMRCVLSSSTRFTVGKIPCKI